MRALDVYRDFSTIDLDMIMEDFNSNREFRDGRAHMDLVN